MTHEELVTKLTDALRQSGDVAPMYRALMRYGHEAFLNPDKWNTAVMATREAQEKVWHE